MGFETERYDAFLEEFFLGIWDDFADIKSHWSWLKWVGESEIWLPLASNSVIEQGCQVLSVLWRCTEPDYKDKEPHLFAKCQTPVLLFG